MNITHRHSITAVLVSVMTIFSREIVGFQVVLLTHANELRRPTNTGQILRHCLDNDCGRSRLSGTFSGCQIWSWSGRIDNVKVAKLIDDTHNCVLVWVGSRLSVPVAFNQSNASHMDTLNHTPNSGSCGGKNSTYIVLDGTWQEAKRIFRHGPDRLRSLSRISLSPNFKTTYLLRKNLAKNLIC